MQYSRRQFNATMLAAMGSLLTRRALAQTPSTGSAAAGTSDGFAPAPVIPGPVAAGPLDSLQRVRLHAIDDLHLNPAGQDARANLDKITDAMVQLYQQVREGRAQGGEIYFPAGTFAVDQTLRLLPDIALVGESAAGSILRNTSHDGNVYWNAATLFSGHDQPMEGGEKTKLHFRPFAATPQQGDKHVLVSATDYADVQVGDEIKIFGANGTPKVNKAGLSVRRPDFVVKVMVTGKKASGADRVLEIDRPLPWTLPKGGDTNWGELRGQPAWLMVREWFVRQPEYWMQSGNHGFDAYTKLGAQWGQGWTSRRNLFKDITLASDRGYNMVRGMPCDALFLNCGFDGAIPLYGNTMQYTRLENCDVRFTDQVVEFSYNCLYCSFNNIRAVHNAIRKGRNEQSLFTVHERSCGIQINGLSVKAATRPLHDVPVFAFTGDDYDYRHIDLELPKAGTIFEVRRQNPNLLPITNVAIRDLRINMGENTFDEVVSIASASNHVLLEDVKIVAGAQSKHFCKLDDATCHDVTFRDVVSPGAVEAAVDMPKVKVERCEFGGGITGKYASSIEMIPGKPRLSRA